MLLVSLVVVLASPPSAVGQGFTRAFTDDVWFSGSSAANAKWVKRTSATGAKVVLLEVDWVSVEPSAPPAGRNATGPAGPRYNFGYLDTRLKQFARSGISVALLVTDAPGWAQSPGGTATERGRGAWKPNPAALGQLARAMARRYSGSYPDPTNRRHKLPRVKYYQAWAEANFTVHLAPQYVNQGGRPVPFAPTWYRSMLNAFYGGIKSVRRDDVVITTGLGPYGDTPGLCTSDAIGAGCRTPPAQFLRGLLCLSGPSLASTRCPAPAHFDVVAADPYETSSPTTAAYNADDASVPDLWKLTRIVRRALATGRVLPHVAKRLWVTEFSYDSNPPNPFAPSVATQARWLEEAFYLFWSQGVDTAVWYLVRDQTGHDYVNSYFSGVYFYSGAPKPSFTAYRFPFVLMPAGRGARFWGVAPRSGNLVIQQMVASRWRSLYVQRVRPGSVFTRYVSGGMRGDFRALVGAEKSLTWHR